MGLEKAWFLLGDDDKMMVQFNPVTYSVSCPKAVERLYEDLTEDAGIVNSARDEARQLNLELVFYSYDFNVENPNASLGTQAKNMAKSMAKSALKNALGQNGDSASENIEHLYYMIEASQEEEYNGLTFAWGNFVFHGLVSNISFRYDTFNIIGEPGKATVSIQMIETPDPNDFEGFGLEDQIGQILQSSLGDALLGVLPF